MYVDSYEGETSDRQLDELIPSLKAYLEVTALRSGASSRSLDFAKKGAQAKSIVAEDPPFEDCNPVGALLKTIISVNGIKTKLGLDKK